MNMDFKDIEKIISKELEDFNCPSASIAVVKDDKVIYSNCFGYKDYENKIAPDENTVYAIASVTKAMTATALGILVDEGKISWDTPVINYIKDFRMADDYATNHVTLRDMLSHKTGLPRHDMVWYHSGNEKSKSTEEYVNAIRYLKPNKGFRTKYEYNNLMFTASGYVIEKVTGMKWGDFLKERIFKPLEMENTSTEISGLRNGENKAFPYVVTAENKIIKVPYMDFDGMGGCGAVNSTIADMSKWMLYNLNCEYKGKRLLKEETFKEIRTPQTASITPKPFLKSHIQSYALGWGCQTYRGYKTIGHTGAIDGFSSYLNLMTEEKIGIIILTNRADNYMNGAVSNTIYDHLLELPKTEWFAQFKEADIFGLKAVEEENKKILSLKDASKQFSHKNEDLTGKYAHKGYGELEITVEGDELFLNIAGFKYPTFHLNYNTFYSNIGDYMDHLCLIRFSADKYGNIESTNIDIEPNLGELVEFVRA